MDETLRDRVVAIETRLELLAADISSQNRVGERVVHVELEVTGLKQRLDSIDLRLGKIERALLAKGTAVLLVVEIVTGVVQHFTR